MGGFTRKKGFFFCENCQTFHRNDSKIAIAHKKLRRASDRLMMKTIKVGGRF